MPLTTFVVFVGIRIRELAQAEELFKPDRREVVDRAEECGHRDAHADDEQRVVTQLIPARPEYLGEFLPALADVGCETHTNLRMIANLQICEFADSHPFAYSRHA